MNPIQFVVGVVVVGFLAVLAFGLATRRIDWRQQGCCCPADPTLDPRMREADPTTTPGPAQSAPDTTRARRRDP